AIILKWHGLYQQKPIDSGLFMLRIKLPNGIIKFDQLKTILNISRRVGLNIIDLTTRQNIQLRSIELENLPFVFSELSKSGLFSHGSCGDNVRNVIGCPISGLSNGKMEVVNTIPLAKKITTSFLANPNYANLPRKFKIALCGCTRHCVPYEINDIGLVATTNNNDNIGYQLFAGGGLSSQPQIAKNLNIWIPQENIIETITKIIDIFNDFGNRFNRKKARLKHLISDWGTDKFLMELENRLNKPLYFENYLNNETFSKVDHMEIHPQKDPNYCYIGLPVKVGRISSDQLEKLIDIISIYKDVGIRITHYQNIIITNIPVNQISRVIENLRFVDFLNKNNSWSGKVISCTGKEFCNRALTETKNIGVKIIDALDKFKLDDDITIGISGCSNDCGQNRISDIGIQGVYSKSDDSSNEKFNISVKKNGNNNYFNELIMKKINKNELDTLILNILTDYSSRKLKNETFNNYASRCLSEEF
ncbi:MAG: nitrite/sulfite reductase, partial [Cyanobacteriota bacterium]